MVQKTSRNIQSVVRARMCPRTRCWHPHPEIRGAFSYHTLDPASSGARLPSCVCENNGHLPVERARAIGKGLLGGAGICLRLHQSVAGNVCMKGQCLIRTCCKRMVSKETASCSQIDIARSTTPTVCQILKHTPTTIVHPNIYWLV